MDDVFVASLVLVDAAGVVFKSGWNGNTASNWASLVDFLHHVLLTRDLAVFISMIDLVVILIEAAFVSITVFAHDLSRAFSTIIVSSCSID